MNMMLGRLSETAAASASGATFAPPHPQSIKRAAAVAPRIGPGFKAIAFARPRPYPGSRPVLQFGLTNDKNGPGLRMRHQTLRTVAAMASLLLNAAAIAHEKVEAPEYDRPRRQSQNYATRYFSITEAGGFMPSPGSIGAAITPSLTGKYGSARCAPRDVCG